MNSIKSIVISVVVAVILAVIIMVPITRHFASPAQSPATPVGGSAGASGETKTNIDWYVNGLRNGDLVSVHKSLAIGPGQNQASFKNKTGRPMIIENPQIGWYSGTASSSYIFAIGTSTASAYTGNFTRQIGNTPLLDGVVTATSSVGPQIFTATTSSAGLGPIILPDGQFLVAQVQERFACKAVGNCETATSSNRGVSNFFVNFVARYAQ